MCFIHVSLCFDLLVPLDRWQVLHAMLSESSHQAIHVSHESQRLDGPWVIHLGLPVRRLGVSDVLAPLPRLFGQFQAQVGTYMSAIIVGRRFFKRLWIGRLSE